MIIDFHTHIFPDKIAERTIEILRDNTCRIQGTRADAALNGTLDALKQSMQEHEIAYSVVLPIATTVTQSSSINTFAAQINGTDGIFSFGSIHPMQENWESELERIARLGLLGIKLHPEYQGVYIDSEESIRVLKKCEQLGLMVMLHAGRDIGIAPPVHCTPQMLSRALDHVDGSRIIAAHMGGWRMWDEVEAYLIGSRIYLDTSFCVHEMSEEQFVRMIQTHTADRILHATDSPWEQQGKTAAYIKALALSDTEKDKILYKNAKKLLKIM